MMLTRFHKVLLGMLVVQLLLVFLIAGRGRSGTSTVESKLLPDFDVAKVTRVQVFGPPGATPPAAPIDLVKKGANWVLASGFDYPVEAKKLDELLTPISKMASASPVGTKASSHRQYKVAEDEFERKLVITSEGGKDVTLFVGGPTRVPRRSAVRLGGEENVHAVAGVTAYLASTEPRGWIQTSYARGNRDDVVAVTIAKAGGTVELKRIVEPGAGSGSGSDAPPPESKWSIAIDGAALELKPTEELDQDALGQVAGAVTDFDASAPADPKRNASKPTVTITVVRKADKIGATPTTIFDAIADGERYWFKQRDQDKAIMIEKSRLEPIMALNREKAIKKPPPEQPKAPGEPGAGSGSDAGSGSAARPVVPPPPPP